MIAWTFWNPAPSASFHGSRKLKIRSRRYGSIQIATRPPPTAKVAARAKRRSGHARDEQDPRDHRDERDRGAEVRLDHDHGRERADDEPDGLHQLGHGLRRRPPGQDGADPDAHGELRELRRLEADRTDDEPAVRAVDRRPQDEHGRAGDEGADEQDRREGPERVVVDPRQAREKDEPADGVEALLDEEPHRVALAERRGRRRRAEDHHEPEGDEPEGDEDEQPLLELSSVRASAAGHPESFCTRRRNSSPRCSKLVNWSNEAQAGESRTTSPADAAAPPPRAPRPACPGRRTGRRAPSSAAASSSTASPTR